MESVFDARSQRILDSIATQINRGKYMKIVLIINNMEGGKRFALELDYLPMVGDDIRIMDNTYRVIGRMFDMHAKEIKLFT